MSSQEQVEDEADGIMPVQRLALKCKPWSTHIQGCQGVITMPASNPSGVMPPNLRQKQWQIATAMAHDLMIVSNKALQWMLRIVERISWCRGRWCSVWTPFRMDRGRSGWAWRPPRWSSGLKHRPSREAWPPSPLSSRPECMINRRAMQCQVYLLSVLEAPVLQAALRCQHLEPGLDVAIHCGSGLGPMT